MLVSSLQDIFDEYEQSYILCRNSYKNAWKCRKLEIKKIDYSYMLYLFSEMKRAEYSLYLMLKGVKKLKKSKL